ncbi:potassium channel family protein [Caproiciproducens faecalis]|uniref:TrkA family potassium uptake protein n=1 Tax=Caproiciproducens faecalis TaxID=2820301 RepID=A0ABS7DRC6_9FIRM|nr:TrkA family potassium uptake protein [Caproiciproducens faecalis]MBW7573851.1 TrkA family potassium uptake protein [Caproiciproducens faecalis]
MRLFVKEKSNGLIIVGCGRLGSSLARTMAEEGQNVTVIDCDENALQKLPASYEGCSVIGDGTDTDILETAGIRHAAALIAATDDDAANIMIAQIASRHYQLKNVIAYVENTSKAVNSPEINMIMISPTILSVKEAQKILFHVKEEKAV